MRISDWSSDVCSSDLRAASGQDDQIDLRYSRGVGGPRQADTNAQPLNDRKGRSKAQPRRCRQPETEEARARSHGSWGRRAQRRGAALRNSRLLSRSAVKPRSKTVKAASADNFPALRKKIGSAHVCTPVTNAHLV